ncbi:hypothetical protein VTK73DRAFT_3452 [Phialemonium thermophilum]|uniref:Uncharacterized protein n=1 Tax=Phialemonium thermophilum TaxID=223376 RepID=A0ABR3WZH7_9PEZI
MLNLFRQVFSALISFYAIDLAEQIQFQYAWLVFSLINVVFLVPMAFLRIYGKKIRTLSWQPAPTFHNDI